MSKFVLRSAELFSIQELTDIYNQTRIDYIVPMPMNVSRLEAYIRNYDLDLKRSVVAVSNGEAIGLAMLGVRDHRTWITRLGVVPSSRHLGAGEALMRYLIDQSRELQVNSIVLEVILNNKPAYRLFRKLGFEETRDLLILRRPPRIAGKPVVRYTHTIIDDDEQVVKFLKQRKSSPSWLDDFPSLINAGDLHAIQVELDQEGWGWIVYQKTIFQLGRIVVQTEAGDPYLVGCALLHALHSINPIQDTKTENVPRLDTHLKAFQEMKYLESFARIEMQLYPTN